MHRWNLQDPQNWVDRSGCSFHCQEHMDLFLWDVSTCRPIIWYQTDVVASLTFHLSPLWNDFNSGRVELARNTWHNNAEIARTFQRTWINHIQSPVSPVQCAFKECHIPRKWRGRQFSQQYTVWSIYTWTLQCPKSRVNSILGPLEDAIISAVSPSWETVEEGCHGKQVTYRIKILVLWLFAPKLNTHALLNVVIHLHTYGRPKQS